MIVREKVARAICKRESGFCTCEEEGGGAVCPSSLELADAAIAAYEGELKAELQEAKETLWHAWFKWNTLEGSNDEITKRVDAVLKDMPLP